MGSRLIKSMTIFVPYDKAHNKKASSSIKTYLKNTKYR